MGTFFGGGDLMVLMIVWQTVHGVDPGWTEWNGHQYKWISDEIGLVGPDDAVRACAERCAYVAVPSSRTENDFLWAMYQSWSPQAALWIGCSQDAEGDWSCAEGEGEGIDTGYRNWDLNELDLVNDPSRCSILARKGVPQEDGQWRAKLCEGSTRHVICEKEIRQPFNERAMCDSAGRGCAALELIRRLESRHLSRVATADRGSRYRMQETATGSSLEKYSLPAPVVTEGRMRVASYGVGVDYCNGEL